MPLIIIVLFSQVIDVVLFYFSMDDSEPEREDQSSAGPAASKKKCLFDDSIVGKVCIYMCRALSFGVRSLTMVTFQTCLLYFGR